MKVTVDCGKEIARLEKEKEELVDRFIRNAENINAQIKYLKALKKKKGGAV